MEEIEKAPTTIKVSILDRIKNLERTMQQTEDNLSIAYKEIQHIGKVVGTSIIAPSFEKGG